MLHSKQMTLAINGSSTSTTRREFIANRGVISNVWVNFPPGCAGLVKLRIFHEGHPFLPVEADATITGDGVVYRFPVMYEITDAPEQITIEAWNEDDTYTHIIDIMFLIIPKAWVQPVGASEGIIAALKALVLRRV